MVKGVVFDMDGLMVDSEPLHYVAYKHVLKRYGVDFTEDMNAHWIGVSEANGSQEMVERFHLPIDAQALLNEKDVECDFLTPTMLKPQEGVQELITKLYRDHVLLGIASGSTRKTIDSVMSFLGVNKMISAIGSSEDVKQGKPSPNIYLFVAKKLGVPPSECVALEDAPKGVESAIAAGMNCIAVPSAETKSMDFSKATYRIDSLTQAYKIISQAVL